ncbi:hypothetical protein [Selenomonas noxia]|jgi:hypothetical protein|uniref:hypothetical protein n=1 Tax=Selenomonas noxia TaxID=135083 RepID=UPI001CAC7346|nr:hypothetical protein [Selenomonas noxia]MBF1662396.1 hypothetical protein [Selenomonas noxia]
MPERPYAQNAFESMRERRKREMEIRLARVKELRISYQRKIIGTAVIFFIILIIVCALLPSDDAAGYESKWNKDINSRQAQILQSLEENFK